METALWIVTSTSALCWLASWALFARLRCVPRPGGEPSPAERSISIIIPARDEEENIGRLLTSLKDQPSAPHEVIVVDDQSRDRTAAVAEAEGAVVVPGEALPEGWLGKPWACQQGARAATGEWFLFLDADTEFEEGGFSRLARLATNEEEVHSVCPFHAVRKPFEQLSAFFNVIMILGMNAFTLRGDRASGIGLFGQAMLVSRREYEAVGGHSPVRNQVLENFHLAEHFRAGGARPRCWLGAGTIRMRMFPHSCGDLIAGWSKGIISGADNTARSALAGISVWLSGLFMAAVPLCFAPFVSPPLAGTLAAVYLLSVLQVAYLFRKAGTFTLFSALTFPVGLVFYQIVFFRALRLKRQGKTVKWKGRHVG